MDGVVAWMAFEWADKAGMAGNQATPFLVQTIRLEALSFSRSRLSAGLEGRVIGMNGKGCL